MIAVTGATGHLGHLVLAELAKKVPPHVIVAAARNLDKAQSLSARGYLVRLANYDEPETLEDALQGVEKLLLISGSEVGKRTPQHLAVLSAASKAGVKLIVYTSLLRADTAAMPLAQEHVSTELALRASGIPFVVLRNGWYTENYTENLAPALQHGAILGAAKDGKISAAARADYAAAAAEVLTSGGHEGKVYELAGDDAFSMADLATEVTRQSGKPVVYTDLPPVDYATTLQSFGLPKPFADLLASADEGVTRGELFSQSSDLRKLMGRSTTPLSVCVSRGLEGLPKP